MEGNDYQYGCLTQERSLLPMEKVDMTFYEFVAQKEQNQNIVNSVILSIKKK